MSPDPSSASHVTGPPRRQRSPVPRLLRPPEPVLLALPKAGLTGSNRKRKTAAGPPLPARGFCRSYPPAGAQGQVKGRDSRVFTLGFTSTFPWAVGRNDEESMTFQPVRGQSRTIQNTTSYTGATPTPPGLSRSGTAAPIVARGRSGRWLWVAGLQTTSHDLAHLKVIEESSQHRLRGASLTEIPVRRSKGLNCCFYFEEYGNTLSLVVSTRFVHSRHAKYNPAGRHNRQFAFVVPGGSR